MTAPTTGATPKIALDRRAQSRQDYALRAVIGANLVIVLLGGDAATRDLARPIARVALTGRPWSATTMPSVTGTAIAQVG